MYTDYVILVCDAVTTRMEAISSSKIQVPVCKSTRPHTTETVMLL